MTLARTVRKNNAIRLLPLADAFHALLAIDGPAAATFNTIVEATEEGPAGDDVTLALAAGGTWVPNIGTLTAAANPTNAKASLSLAGPTTHGDSIVEEKAAGSGGNSTTLAFVADGTGTGTLNESAYPAIVFHYESGVTTVSDFEAAVTASTHLAVKSAGTGSNVFDGTDAFAATNLAGGTTETVTIGSTVYTFKNTLASAYDVKIAGTASLTLDNLIAAINANGTAGSQYGNSTVVHPSVRAFAGAGDTMVVHTKPTILNAVGTLIATTETCAQCSWGATTLADGTDGDNVVFSADGTDISCVFSSGYTTVSDFEEALAAADEDVTSVLRLKTAGTTPLYQLLVTDDDFAATNLTGGGDDAQGGPTDVDDGDIGAERPFYADEAMCLVKNDAGSGTITVTVTIWGWSDVTESWHVVGELNEGTAIPETSVSNKIRYCEPLIGIGCFRKFWAEVSSAGTGEEFEVWLDFGPPSRNHL